MLINGVKASEVVMKTKFRNVDLLPSDMNLAGAEVEMIGMDSRESLLKKLSPMSGRITTTFS